MRARFFFCKEILMGCALMFLGHSMYAQSKSAFHAFSHENSTRQLRTTITSSDTISLEGMGNIYSLSIDATIYQPQERSFTRIVLEDNKGHDYLVAESNWFRFDTTTVSLDHYCEETAILNGITPVCLKCYVTGDATITLMGINSSNQTEIRGAENFTKTSECIKEEQVKAVVDKINGYNTKHGRLWKAGVTDISLLPFNERKSQHETCDSYLNNMLYYSGGLFEVGVPRAYTDTISSPYVPSFDWRNRHGRCWLTPIKHQGKSFYCGVFAAIGMLESNLLLHYNYDVNDTSAIDLSEQYVASYGRVSYLTGSTLGTPIWFLKRSGTIDDASMPFVDDSSYIPEPIDSITWNEHVYLNDFESIFLNNNLPLDTLKKYIIHSGPGSWGYQQEINSKMKGHAMTLSGYGTIVPDTTYIFCNGDVPEITFQNTDSIIGHTYWIFKNSWGKNWGHNGYMYVVYYNDDKYFMESFAYFPKGIPTSTVSRSILCEDLDGDGYFNWGIEAYSPHVPIWAQSDGDDSNPTIGHMNEYGYCESLPSDHPTYEYIYNDSTLTTSENRTSYLGVLRGATVTLHAQQNFTNGTKLLLDSGATLVIDGITINLDFLQPYPGSKIVLINGAKVLKPFAIPLGVELVINKGSIE